MDFREDEFDVFEKGDFMETIRNVEINQLHDFKNHPFKVEVMAVIEERIRQAAREEARQEANKEVLSMVGSMLAAMQANKGAISIIQQQADTDDNTDSDDDFYDDVIAQSALNWMEKD